VALVLYGASPQLRSLLRGSVLNGVTTYDDRADALAGVASAQVVRSQRVALRLAPVPAAPMRARELIADACRVWDLDRLRGPAVLVISELVSNAVQHAGTDFLVQITRRGDYLHLSVRDGSPEQPRLPDASPDGGGGMTERGRGLQLVDSYATAWGSSLATDGKVVWATLRATPIRDR
jgi:anti-sigma regulatory factor (Ser/Thr protein kinase)